jgi:hypothetical protein
MSTLFEQFGPVGFGRMQEPWHMETFANKINLFDFEFTDEFTHEPPLCPNEVFSPNRRNLRT